MSEPDDDVERDQQDPDSTGQGPTGADRAEDAADDGEPIANPPEGGGELADRPYLMQTVDTLLRSPGSVVARIGAGRGAPMLLGCLVIAAACHLAYGVILGGFSGGVQWLASPIKLLLGTALSMLLCYPSLYVFSCLAGADLRLSQAVSLMVSGFALVGLLLVAFVPVAFIFTFSTDSLGFMGGIHFVIWGISVGFGIRFFQDGLGALGSKNPGFIKLWSIVFVLTMLQMSTTLRPLLGSSDHLLTGDKQFFLAHWIEVVRRY